MKMIKKGNLKRLLHLLGYVYPYSLSCFLNRILDTLYTQRILHSLPNANYDISIKRTIRIIGGDFIKIGDSVTIGRFSTLSTWNNDSISSHNIKLDIGRGVSIGEFNHITSVHSIEIGEYCLFGKFVTITDNNHGDTTKEDLMIAPIYRNISSKGGVVIRKNVWVGDKATILAGVHIGEGSVIAANSVVTKDIPSYSVAAGNPARIIKTLI